MVPLNKTHLNTYNQIWELVMCWKRSFSTDDIFSDNRINNYRLNILLNFKVNTTKYSLEEMVQKFISNNFSHDIKQYISRMTKRGIQFSLSS